MIALTLTINNYEFKEPYIEFLSKLEGVTIRPFIPVYGKANYALPSHFSMTIFALDDEIATMLTLKYGDKIMVRSA